MIVFVSRHMNITRVVGYTVSAIADSEFLFELLSCYYLIKQQYAKDKFFPNFMHYLLQVQHSSSRKRLNAAYSLMESWSNSVKQTHILE